MRLLCIDGNSILNRSFYGVRELTARDGTPTNAVYGFLNILIKMLKEVEPDGVAVAFDLPAPTFRHKMYDGYKANRKGMPDDLRVQMPIAKELIRLLGYHVCELEGYEADDILGAFSKSCTESGDECVIATGDRDSLQLVSDTVTVRLATTKETIVYTPQKILEVYGVTPRQLIEVKALMGDSSDNIPGVSGCGEKTALGLIAKFSTLDGVYAHLDDPFIKPKMRERLQQDKETAYLSRTLAEIALDLPMDVTPAHYLSAAPDAAGAVKRLTELDMQSMPKKLHLDASAPPEPEPEPERAVYRTELNPDYQTAAALLKAEKTLDFLCTFSEGELQTLSLSADGGRQLIEYNFNAAQAFETLVCADDRPKRTNQAKQIYRYALLRGLTVAPIVLDLELGGYLLDSGAKDYLPETLLHTYLPERESDAFMAVFSALADRITAELTRKNLAGLLTEIEIPFCEVLASMENVGFYIDRDGVTAFGQMLEARIEEITAQIYTLAGEEFNINSTQHLARILFEKLGLPAGKKTKSGYSTNAQVLERLADRHPIVPLVLEYRQLSKLNSTYVIGLRKEIQPDGRIHSVFKQTEARTGRISSTEPNMQNIPVRTPLGSEMRKFFVAKEGCLLVDADYSQIELRLLAHISQDAHMIEAFQNGADIHAMTASKVFGVPLDRLPPELRSRAKAINFGIVYGIGAFSLSRDLGVPVAQASQYIQDYLATYAGVRRYMTDIVEQGRRDGYVTTLFHRRRDLPELRVSNKNIQAFGERAAMNTPIQGTAADVIKIAMIRVYRRLKAEHLRAQIILQVHDEIILEADERDAPRALQLLTEEMEQAVKLSVPLPVDGKIAKSWYLAKQ